MRMRQSLAQLEAAFHEEQQADRERREALLQQAEARTHSRRRERTHRDGRVRFFGLILILILTAVGVTVAMFETLYYVIG